MKKTILLSLVLSFALHFSLDARVKLPAVLSDNMVLQQQSEVKLWGKAEPRSIVVVRPSWNGYQYSKQADKNGDWEVKVPTPEAGGPYSIRISDGEEILLNNVLIGEVWFCSGQSNMEMPLEGFHRQPVDGSNDAIAKAKPTVPIRFFSADTQVYGGERQFSKVAQTDCVGQWSENTPEAAARTSAVGYFFARYLQEVLDVPVGIIVSSWGGSHVEAWMSRETLAAFPSVDLSILDNDVVIDNPTDKPCVLYNAKLAPLNDYVVKGFLWYQGESNRHNADLYVDLMPAFVKQIRQDRQQSELPFYFVQIAPYNYEGADGTSAARLREAQEQNWKDIPHSGMVTTGDIGHPEFIHPTDKQTVGKRLAYWALGDTYNKKGFEYIPPTYKSMEVSGNKIYVNFHHAERGISPMWTALPGFEIAGADLVFHPAEAEIETQTARLAVHSDRVPNPVAVRYAYKNYVPASIFSVNGLPVAPFRTDK